MALPSLEKSDFRKLAFRRFPTYGKTVSSGVAAWKEQQLRYLLFAASFFLRSAHRFFIISDSFLRPAALSLLVRFALAALLIDALLVR
jgi:hypothetical protein